MSEYLNNKEYKKETLKRLIGDLHKGRDFEEVKREFQQLVDGVDSVEIADMEQELIEEGLSPEEKKGFATYTPLFSGKPWQKTNRQISLRDTPCSL